MDIYRVLRESFDTFRGNLVIAVPPTLAIFLNFLIIERTLSPRLLADGPGEFTPEEVFTRLSTMFMVVLSLWIVNGVINLFALGATLGMAKEAINDVRPTVTHGVKSIQDNFSTFIIAGVSISVITTLGLMIFYIPGFAFMFFAIFTFPAIVIEGLGPLDAFKRSVGIISSNSRDTFIFFVSLIALFLAGVFAASVLCTVPVFGQFMGLVVTGMVGGFTAVYMLKAYKALGAAEAEEGGDG